MTSSGEIQRRLNLFGIKKCLNRFINTCKTFYLLDYKQLFCIAISHPQHKIVKKDCKKIIYIYSFRRMVLIKAVHNFPLETSSNFFYSKFPYSGQIL